MSYYKQTHLSELLDALDKQYPDAHCELMYGTPFQLLVSVILSAQCTDKRVNEITPKLFERASTPAEMDALDLGELEKLVYSCGFYHNKAKNIKLAARAILEKFGGEVPKTIDELVTLPGVGRKTANVVFAVAFHGEAMPVDTHVFRLAHRLGLSEGKTPAQVEKDLRAVIPENMYSRTHHLLIFHGRYACKSRRPECENCPVTAYCGYFAENNGKIDTQNNK